MGLESDVIHAQLIFDLSIFFSFLVAAQLHSFWDF